jgi:hypothetical protein
MFIALANLSRVTFHNNIRVRKSMTHRVRATFPDIRVAGIQPEIVSDQYPTVHIPVVRPASAVSHVIAHIGNAYGFDRWPTIRALLTPIDAGVMLVPAIDPARWITACTPVIGFWRSSPRRERDNGVRWHRFSIASYTKGR